MDAAGLRAVAVSRVLRNELRPAVQARSWLAVEAGLAAAVRVKRGGAVRADDPEVLDAVVGRYAIDVIQDQGHRPTVPFLILATEFALT